MLGMFAEGLRQAGAGLDPALDIHHEAREARVLVTAGDDFERLQQRHTCLEHRRQLPCEECDVLFVDAGTTPESLPAHLDDPDALPPQVGRDDRFRRGLHLAANVAIIAVESLPQVREFLDVLALDPSCCGGCGGHGDSRCGYALLFIGYGLDFLEGSHALPDFEQSRLA